VRFQFLERLWNSLLGGTSCYLFDDPPSDNENTFGYVFGLVGAYRFIFTGFIFGRQVPV